MDISSKRPPRRATIELWRIVLLVAGAFLFALFAIGRVPSRDTHESILTSLRAIDINHASLQRDVLQARAGLLRNYDPIVDSIVNLHATVSKLRKLFPESGVESTAELDAELTKLAASIDGDEKLVERFKTDNALLQNSFSIANQMLSELHESSDPAVVKALAISTDLGNLMMRFAAQPDQRFEKPIRTQLDAMSRSEAASIPDVASYVVHARMILDTLPSVDDTIRSIQASRTSTEAQTLQKEYLDAYGILSVRSAWSRILLGSISVLLCIYIAILVYRLRSQTHRLTQQLEFENLAATIKRRFNEDFDNVSAALTDSLGAVADFFDCSSYAFAVVSSDVKEVEQLFGNVEASLVRSLLERLFEKMAEEKVNGDRPYYHNLQKLEIQAFPEGALSAGSITAMSIDASSAGILFLEHTEVRKKPDRDEIRLLGHAIVVLIQSLQAQREREEKRALEARLEHSQRLEAVGTLAGGIAHEFNNTLGAILGYGEMALESSRSSTRTRQYIQQILSSGHRAKHIIDQILTFSRKRERVNRPFDLKEAIEDIVPLVKLSIPGTVSVSTAIDTGLPSVFGNPIEIQQVLMNLCMNAAQASAEEGHIEISLKKVEFGNVTSLSHSELPRGDYVLLSVKDNGDGIAKSILPHIFEPFFTTRAKSGGTGLGLAAVHGHVTGMNGRIDVESRPSEGTEFKLYFPAIYEDPVPLGQFFNERTIPLGTGQLVLLAQRDTSLRLMYEEKIAALQYEPVGFASMAALKRWLAAAGRLPDLVLLDLDLWQDTPDLGKIVKEFEMIPILFLADPGRDGNGARPLDRISLLRKPVSSISLATALFNKIGRRSALPDVAR